MKIQKFRPFSDHDQPFLRLHQQLYHHTDAEDLSSVKECFLAYQGKEPIARLSIQTTQEGIGIIGHYESLNDEAGVALLEEAKRELIKQGMQRVIGPMNGNTWGRYRLAVPQEEAYPPFFLEPQNLSGYCEQFLQAGFCEIAAYQSRSLNDLTASYSKSESLFLRMQKRGVVIKTLKKGQFLQVLRSIYQLSVEAFAGNLYYSQISFEAFRKMYVQMRPLLDPDFICLAYSSAGELIAFLFAYPDLYDQSRVILKTLACRLKWQGMGIPLALMEQIHQTAYRKKYQSCIHSLMQENNPSIRLSKECYPTTLFRRYLLYGFKPGLRPVIP